MTGRETSDNGKTSTPANTHHSTGTGATDNKDTPHVHIGDKASLTHGSDSNAWADVYNDLKYGQTIGTTDPAAEQKFVKSGLLPHIELNQAINFAVNGGHIDTKS